MCSLKAPCRASTPMVIGDSDIASPFAVPFSIKEQGQDEWCLKCHVCKELLLTFSLLSEK